VILAEAGLQELTKRGQVAADPTTQKRLGTALFYCIVILLAYLVYLIFAPVGVALAWAAVLVVVCYPVFEVLADDWGRTKAAIVSTLGVTVVLIVPILFVTFAFIRQGISAVQSIHFGLETGHYAWLANKWAWIQERFPNASPDDLTDALHRYAEEIARYAGARMGFILRHTAEFVFHLSVTIIAMFYFFRDGDLMLARLRDVLPFEPEHRDRMLDEARNMIFASVTSSLVSAAAHGILDGIAFAVLGVKAPIFWGVMLGFSSLVPVVGSALVWVPVSISLMISGHIGRGIALMVLCILVSVVLDYVVRPWLISGRAQMNGLLIFISVLGGISVFGMLGIVLGPMITAIATSVLDAYAPPAPARNKKAATVGKKADAVLE
jgi:predicted PurR-regulated permease PerM